MPPIDHQFRVLDHVPKLDDGSWKCNYCQKTIPASISCGRIIYHLAKEPKKGIAICENVPEGVKDAARLAISNIKQRDTKKRGTKTQTCSSSKKRRTAPQPATSTSSREQNTESANRRTEDWRSTEPATSIFTREQNIENANPTLVDRQGMPAAPYIRGLDPFDRFGDLTSRVRERMPMENETEICPGQQNNEDSSGMDYLGYLRSPTPCGGIDDILSDNERSKEPAIPTFPGEQNNGDANLTQSGTEGVPTKGLSTEPETGENRNFSGAQDGNHIENMTIEMQQPIQTIIHSERFAVHDRETKGAAIQPIDEGQINLVENGAAQEHQPTNVEMQWEHQPLLDLFSKMEINAKAALWPLFEKLMSPDVLEIARKKQVDGELKKWYLKLLTMQSDLDVAEVKQVTNLGVKFWLSNLSDLAYDADNILDGFQTEALRSQLKRAESQGSTSTATQGLPTSCADPRPSSASRDMVTQSKLKNITTRLEELDKEKNELCLQTNSGTRSNIANNREDSTPFVTEPKVYGREKVKEELVELLLHGDVSNSLHSVIPIVGMPGVGKTTVAQLACNDGRLKFDHQAWVCVSDEFDITRMTKTILLQVGGDPEANDLTVLQRRLKDKLHKKKFLIVLDDIWEHKYNDWTKLCSPFAAGAPGSKIIVTTRSKDISSRLGTTIPFELKELSYDECLCLFSQHAVDAENLDAHPDLKDVGEKIVKKCKGLPLAAKTLGGLLRHNQQLRDWEDVLNSEIWHLSEESDILPALRLSYHHLPSHLKQCFAYCAIFPKDYEFDKDELVLLWMAEGFIQQPGIRQQGKDLGQKCFDDLLSRCLFQESSCDNSRYVMHDLLNDLAQFVSGHVCFRLDDKLNTVKLYANVRHSSIICQGYDISKRFEEVFHEMKSLRTLVVLQTYFALTDCFLSSKVLNDLVPKLKCLRSLSLDRYYCLKELPNSIHALEHLRYLSLSYTSIERLPESLGELLNLQTLKLCGCLKLVELPACIGNLINLQCLDVSETDSLRKMPPEISKLKNLITLPKFIVGEGSGLGIGDLKKLPHLRGQLHITGLHNIANIHEAKCFNLNEKQGLDVLALEWSDDFHDVRNLCHECQVLNSLQPHRSLEKLSITSYGGTVFPLWVSDPSLTKLVRLQLFSCRRITSLPSLGKLPALRNLRLKGLNKVTEVFAEGFLSLETLEIEDMVGWEQWCWSYSGLNEDAAVKFPKLHALTLINCPVFVGNWPRGLSSLIKLEIRNCHQLADLPEALPSLCVLNVDYCQAVLLRSVHHFTSLTKLKICGISGLVSLYESVPASSIKLEDLEIDYCHDMEYLWEDGSGLGRLPTTLKRLRLFGCEKLVFRYDTSDMSRHNQLEDLTVCGLSITSFPTGYEFPISLKTLDISFCKMLKSLPSLHALSHLTKLEIKCCNELEFFPERGLPLPNLIEFEISECMKLRCLPSRMEHLTYLQDLIIWSCNSIECFPEGGFPPNLMKLDIKDCEKLTKQPMSEWGLHVLTSLRRLSIGFRTRGNLDDYFPDEDGLPLPTSLTDLTISVGGDLDDCFPDEDGLPLPTSLTDHTISVGGDLDDCFPDEDGLLLLTSLTDLTISVGGDLGDCFPDEYGLVLPTSLTDLTINRHDNLKSISKGIQHLTSLEELTIFNCPKLESLPKEGFPPTLGRLQICNSPLLEGRCLKDTGDYWPIIEHIPDVKIYQNAFVSKMI